MAEQKEYLRNFRRQGRLLAINIKSSCTLRFEKKE